MIAASGGEGHLGPLLPFAVAAVEQGDEVLVVVPPEQADTVDGLGLPRRLTTGVDPATLARLRAAMATADPATRTRLAEVELFGRLCTAAALPGTTDAVARFRPDLVLREPCDYASALAAFGAGIPTAQVAVSPGRADLTGLRLASEVVEPLAPGVTAAVERAPYLTRFPEHDAGFDDVRPYGAVPAPLPRPATDRPLVWLTLGTVNPAFEAAGGTWEAALAALGGLPVDVVASVGRGGARPAAPPNVRVVDWVPAEEVLARAALVVCHGGSGTTQAALAAGVPLVVVPMLADQPANAAMVQRLGAGLTVAPDSGPALGGLKADDVPRLRVAVERVLGDPAFAAAAGAAAAGVATRPSPADRLAELRSGA